MVNSAGLLTWSQPLSFQITALAAPILNVPTHTNTLTPSFSWSTVTGAAHYDVEVDDLTTGTQQVIRLSDVPGTTLTLTAAQALTLGHQYQWKVGAVSVNGLVEIWSTSQAFAVT